MHGTVYLVEKNDSKEHFAMKVEQVFERDLEENFKSEKTENINEKIQNKSEKTENKSENLNNDDINEVTITIKYEEWTKK